MAQEIFTFRAESGVFLDKKLNKVFGILWKLNRVVNFGLVNLNKQKITLKIFSMISFLFSPSNGTLPVKI